MLHLQPAPDVQQLMARLASQLAWPHLQPDRIFCFRSAGSRARARARIWAMPRIWQQALAVPPGYCLEVLSEHFDHLSATDQAKVIIHELMHIPKTFSGALLPHRHHGKMMIDARQVAKIFNHL